MDLQTLRKKAVLEAIRLVEEKIATANQSLLSLQESGNSESKSSMGDKYETSRELIQLEKQKVASQLETYLKFQKILNQLPSPKNQPGPGSLVQTDRGLFLICVGLGQITVPDTVYCLSPVSPLGQLFCGAQPGGEVSFNKITYRIIGTS